MSTPLPLKNLAMLRQRNGLSQRQLAHNTGIGYQIIRRLEAENDAGHLNLKTITRLTEELNCTIEQLLGSKAVDTPASEVQTKLSTAQLKLLRRIHRGDYNSATLTQQDRQVNLPALINKKLLEIVAGQPRPTSDVLNSLMPPA